MYFISVVV